MSNPHATIRPSSEQDVFEQLAAKPQMLMQLRLVVCVLAVLVPVLLLVIGRGWATGPQLAIVITSIGALTIVITTFVCAMPNQGRVPEADRVRIYFLLVVAEVGFFASALSLFLLAFSTRYKAVVAGGFEKLRDNISPLLLCGGLFFGGLVLMFLGLQMARRFERQRSDLRRLLYGYNALLSVMLVAVGLGLLNYLSTTSVKPFNWFSRSVDWTSSGMYTLKPDTIKLLESVQQPIKVYLLMSEFEAKEAITLLDNCRGYTDKISWETVSRDRDSKTLLELQRKFLFREASGMLVVFGTGDNQVSEFIKSDDLFEASREGFRFKGQGALVKAIEYLSSGKVKTVIYVTQGNGELDVQGRGPAMGGRAGDDSLSIAWRSLARGNNELRELRFSADVTRVPDDADIVLVARPTKRLPQVEISALRDFMSRGGEKKGKLFVLTSVNIVGDKIEETGLEPLLLEYGVRLNNDRLLNADDSERDATVVIGVVNPDSTTPMVSSFSSRGRFVPFKFRLARSVDPAAGAEGPVSRFNVQSFVVGYGPVWSEKNLTLDAEAKAEQLRKNDAELEKAVGKGFPTIAVTATEPRMGARSNPHAFMGGGEQQPRLVVFGNAAWISDSIMSEPSFRGPNFALFTSCMSWLRERPDVTSDISESDERKLFVLEPKPGELLPMFLQPAFLMILAVVGLGGAVWVIRRR
jgi:hypothetical protein